MSALFNTPKMPTIPASPTTVTPPQLPNPAVGDSIQEQTDQARSNAGVDSTIKTSPQGITQGGPTARTALVASLPADMAATIIGGAGGLQSPATQNKSLLG